jgi:NAD(P)-dependent dehydrogenase (short-subunit alcohol dehydrogenase family)
MQRARHYDFNGKVVLITGGSRGLGLVLARQLAAEGARIALCARDEEDLESARRELAAAGIDVFTSACDLREYGQVEQTARAVVDHFGAIDVLVNNAGTIAVGPLENMTLDDYHEQMDSNFWSAVHMTMAVLPEMRRRHSGRIVNITSIGGKIAVPHLLPYSASKFAFVGFSRGLRAEVYKDGIVVTTVCPGLMRTGSPRNADFKGQHRAEYAWFSISDSLPGISMPAERAAREIVEACREGRVEIILSGPAKFGATFDALLPEISGGLMALGARVLPRQGGVGQRRMKGHESQSVASPSPLTTLGDSAAMRNNEV